jgi:LPS-assembly lipoprotein
MWWCKQLVVVGLLLAGCGYRPLYGEHGPDSIAVVDKLAAIRIEAIPDRIGQQLYNMLRERLNPNGRPDRPEYVLSVRLTETRQNFFLEKDETATRANLTLRATYVLKRADGGDVVATGTSRAVSSYDILSSQFASVVSEQDARVRSARTISDDIRTRLALALSAARAGGS